MNSKPQTPLEKLTAEKIRIKKETKEQEIKLNQHVTYVQANAGSLFLSFFSSMLFNQSDKKTSKALPADSNGEAKEPVTTNLSFADFIPFTKLLIPAVWEISKPILISWSIKKASSVVTGLFSRKKDSKKH